MKRFPLLLSIALAATAAAQSLSWTRVNPRPHGDSLSHVRFLDNQFVAVGSEGRFGTSPDGIDWNWQQLPGGPNLTDVSLLDGRHVCPSFGRMLYSDDGAAWMESPIDPDYTILGMVAAADLYVAVGYWRGQEEVGGSLTFVQRGIILTSPDGETWTESYRLDGDDNTRVWLRDVTHAQNQFVVVGGQLAGAAETRVLTSPDGLNWTLEETDVVSPFSSIAFGGGRYVAVGPSSYFATSTDGKSWTGDYDFTNRWGVAYGDGTFVTVPGQIPFGGAAYASTTTDGETWTDSFLEINRPLAKIAHGNDIFVAVGSFGQVLSSPDGTDWTMRTQGAVLPHQLWAVEAGGGRFVAVTEGLGIIDSETGTEWRTQPGSDIHVLKGILHDGTQFVAAGGINFSSTTIVTSPDGTTWTPHGPAGASTVIYDLAYRPDPPVKYVAVGGFSASLVLSSDDASMWDDTSPTGEPIHQASLKGIAYGANTFVAVGEQAPGVDASTILTSANGVDWTPRSGPLVAGEDTLDLDSVDFINDRFVAGGQNLVLSSPDGVTWTRHDVGGASTINAVAYHDGLYVAVSNFGGIFESPDLDSWTAVPPLTSLELRDVRHLGDAFYVVGAGATVLRGGADVPAGLPELILVRDPVTGVHRLLWDSAPGVILQQSGDLGSFTDLPEATSPHEPGAAPGPRFFRLRDGP